MGRIFDLTELLEDPLPVLGRDSWTRVLHEDAHGFLAGFDAYRDLTIVGRELQRVA